MSESIINPAKSPGLTKTVWPLRQYVWSVKREIWGNQFLFWGPLVMVLLSVALVCMPLLKGNKISGTGITPQLSFFMTAQMLSYVANLSVLVVGCIYALGTFYNERKDLSILFWKSMPVSDLVSVLAKASLILVVVPLFALLLTWIGILALALTIPHAYGMSLGTLTESAGITSNFVNDALYVVLNAVWWLPVYASLFVVSVFVRTTPIVWVLGILAALGITGMAGLPTNRIVNVISNRLVYFPGTGLRNAKLQMQHGFHQGRTADNTSVEHLVTHPNFAELFTSSALWWGVVVGLVCLALTVWLRRRAEPI